MTCSKIFSGNLPELTYEIVQYFRNDFSTLHSCILVNRLWCRLAIPLLWEDPFSKEYPKNYHFINICLHKLNDGDKIKLNEYRFFTGSSFLSNTLFNYPSFIKCLSIPKVYNSIESWAIKNFLCDVTDVILRNFIFSLLVKIFIENEVNLHTFELEISNLIIQCYDDYFNTALQLILQNPKFICNVKNLSIRLSYQKDSYLSSFIKYFYSNCTSISSVYVHSLSDNYIEKDCLFKLINSQQNLRKIYSFNSNLNLNVTNYSNTLKTITFHCIQLNSLKVNFEQLNVLESIHILYCSSLDSTFFQQIINLTKPFKLKSLFIDERSKLQIESLKLLLQKSGNYLENITIKLYNSEYMLQLYKLLEIYCDKIKFLDILFKNDKYIYLALDLIKNVQQNLNYLSIYLIRPNRKLESIMLENLEQILPRRLEYLKLEHNFSAKGSKVLFKKLQNIFIKKLLIGNPANSYDTFESEDILLHIKKYIMKEKRIEYLAMKDLYKRREKRDLFDYKNVVKEFKFYGIHVKDYDDLCIGDGENIKTDYIGYEFL
ncbi:hypothetical protein RhiirB3_439328 [Rhizophagus irregularis]|nr:hypothetical protein RhiirB3_439328 [Rhizophagus irregularis]